MDEPSGPDFTMHGLCLVFGVDRKALEASIHEGLVPVAKVRKGETRRFNFWEALDIGIFNSLMVQGIARRHAAHVAFSQDFSGLADVAPARRDLWLIVRPVSDRALEGGETRLAFNTHWARRGGAWLLLPKVEPQRADEQKAGRQSYIRRQASIVNVSDIARELREHAEDARWVPPRPRRGTPSPKLRGTE